ncbi:dockerin type I domain-containing protein [Paenibacillus sp. Leaf72]|uniref:dockerin type I domain-containing protein n=1 Tax=Paenibacillus sp. Leaf72 TaxID=1736234 RepID=UPI0006F8C82B|nr:dockerin type I domain-containing protein [Paenibacillus sp. Leaf72]KQO01434.1 hypothetical protein ASF12_16585 [Paenibacillus sp. Leaf72]
MQQSFYRKAVKNKQLSLLLVLVFSISLLFPAEVMGAKAETTGSLLPTANKERATLSSSSKQMDLSEKQNASLQLDPVSDLNLTPYIFSPNWDFNKDYADVTYKINTALSYFSLDVYTVEGSTYTWKGKIMEEANGTSPGSYRVTFSGMVTKGSDYIELGQGHYVIIPRIGLEETDLLMNQLAECIIDWSEPVSELNNPAITVANGLGTIRGRVISDLLVDILGDYSGITVVAIPYSRDARYSGIFTDDGQFSIEVPIQYGTNGFEIVIYDAALNGFEYPKYYVEYQEEEEVPSPEISAVASKSNVVTGEAFDVSIDFAQVNDLYAAQFSLTYDSELLKGTVEPSVTLTNYQDQENAGTALITSEKTIDLGNGHARTDYVVSLAGDINGYSGAGTFAKFHFSSGTVGAFDFELSNLRALNSYSEAFVYETVTNTTVIVTSAPGEQKHTLSGKIAAEAFGSAVDYSSIWYNGSDGVHKVVVEAIDTNGSVAAISEVQANGGYTLHVPKGKYKIRVVVPGHIAVEATTQVNGDMTYNVGPLEAGDVNGNGEIDLADLQLAAKYFGKSKGSGWQNVKASSTDINRDNTVDLLDISFIVLNYKM